MTSRQAKKIVKRNAIRYRRRADGPEDMGTGHVYSESTYRKALRIILRKMDRELVERQPGAIERLAALNAKRNAARVNLLISRAS
jgi:hypothetical protein